MTISALPPAPNRATDTPQQFSDKADAFAAALVTFQQEANADVAGIVNTASVPLWVATNSFSRGNAVYSPTTYLTYRLITASLAGNAANTDPATDTTNWKQVTGTGDLGTTGTQTIVGAKTFSNASNSFSGSGGGLTGIPNTATTAVSTNTANAIVSRDASGNFSAGTITASLNGNATSATSATTATTVSDNAITTVKIAAAAVTPAKLSQPLTTVAAQASTTGTSIDFTAIPTWVRRITVMFNGVSTTGGSQVQVQIGSGTVQTTGYLGDAFYSVSGAVNQNHTTGFRCEASDATVTAATVRHGLMVLVTLGGNVWVENSTIGASNTTAMHISAGSVTLTGVLDRLRVTTLGGTETFDAGSIGLMYE